MNENGASRSLVGNKQEQTSATDVPVSHLALFLIETATRLIAVQKFNEQTGTNRGPGK